VEGLSALPRRPPQLGIPDDGAAVFFQRGYGFSILQNTALPAGGFHSWSACIDFQPAHSVRVNLPEPNISDASCGPCFEADRFPYARRYKSRTPIPAELTGLLANPRGIAHRIIEFNRHYKIL